MKVGKVFHTAAAWLRYEAKVARLFGAGMLKERFYRLARKHECALHLAGTGPIIVRPRDTDVASFVGIFAGPEYDIPIPAVQAVLEARCDAITADGRVPVIVDAGAYVGASSLWFRAKLPKAHIVAIEPDAESFRILKSNLGRSEPATTIQAAVGAFPGQVELVPSGQSWASQVSRSGAGIRVITMNEAFDSVPNGEPLLAKVNIEGFEEDLFSANLEWLDRVSALFIEPHDWLLPGKRTSRSFQKALGDRDFHLFIVGPNLCYARI